MLFEKLLGDWVLDSGWVEMLIDADVTPPGRAESLVRGAHVTRVGWQRPFHLSLSVANLHFDNCSDILFSISSFY